MTPPHPHGRAYPDVMDEQPTRSPAEEFRAELDRRGMTLTPEGAARARTQLAAAEAEWTPERRAALRERSRRGAADLAAGRTGRRQPAA